MKNNAMKMFAMSPAKANRLYWLGRYAERVNMSLHLLRKHYGQTLDNSEALVDFCKCMGISTVIDSTFAHRYLYDKSEPWSLINTLEYLKNNAMIERDEIGSETLAYIELAVNTAHRCIENGEGVYGWQPVTDYLMAFGGAVFEKVQYKSVRNLIKIGCCVERADLMIRFGYETRRIEDVLDRIATADESDLNVCDYNTLEEIRKHVSDAKHYDDNLLKLNTLFVA
ncbi:MAG: hypothetical protein E7069_07630 [Bacteroidales bacterium]|jgi:uncharacterized alpha-E superfamily protein|nr:hypothetical protein [Bacteroidales bacterium]